MMDYKSIALVPFNTEQVAIAVSHSHFNGGHTGIAFHTSKHGPKILHLAWHHRLDLESIPIELKACWVVDLLPTPPKASKQVVAFMRAVSTRLPKINYAVDFIASKGSFDSNGYYKPPKGSKGLTCASFVVEVLRACRINLIQEDTWPRSTANDEWVHAVCNHLQKIDPIHAENVRKSIPSVRLIPFEIAGAASSGPKSWPVTYSDAQNLALSVRNQLNAICAAGSV